MMEIAAGPGGGLFPSVLARNPEARLLINDISAPVLVVWKEVLEEAMPHADLCYAAFDATRPGLRTMSLDIVMGITPFSSTANTPAVVAQAFRSLRSGGTVYIEEFTVSSDDWSRVPEPTRTLWEKRIPGLTGGYAGILGDAGSRVVDDSRFPGRQLRPDEGGLPKAASEHGVLLHTERNIVIARKP